MAPLKKSAVRIAIYGAVLAYLAGDLFVFKGPLWKKVELADPSSPEAIARAKEEGVVARVFNHRITRLQLDRAVSERLWLEGKTPESVPKEMLKVLRYAALNDLIDHELLRVKAKANAPQLKVTEEEIKARFDRFSRRFESRDAMLAAAKSQGIGTEAGLRDLLAARIQQEKYVESKIGPLTGVTDEEAKEWFGQNQRKLDLPERVEVRHIFIATLDHPPEEAKVKLEGALGELAAGKKDFATLAKDLSEDPSTKNNGGSLGWMSRDRLPVDFSAPVFSMPLHKPALVRTRLGWHLVEVTDRKTAEPRTFDDAKPEVLAALRTIKRDKAVNEFRTALRQFETAKIQVFRDMLDY